MVLWTADALSEPGEASERPLPYGDDVGDDVGDAAAAAAATAGAADADDLPPWWSTTFTWNLTHPPPLHPAAVGGGAGLGRGTAATTLFIVVSAETVAEAAGRAERYGGAAAGGGGRARRRAAEDKGVEVREKEGLGRGGEGELLWTLGVAPEVTFR